MEMSCRMCAGIAEPGVCLLDPAQQRLAVCAQDNLNITISADNGYPTRICTSCVAILRKWMAFRDRTQKAHGIFLQTLEMSKPPELSHPSSDVTVVPSLPQSSGEASPDTCSVAVRTGPAEQTATQPSQENSRTVPVTKPKSTLLDKWLLPSKKVILPVLPKVSENCIKNTTIQETIKFSLKVSVERLSNEVLASLKKTGSWHAPSQKKVGCSLPQAIETASNKYTRVSSNRSAGDTATNQQTLTCDKNLSEFHGTALQNSCGEEQLTERRTSLLSDSDDVLSDTSCLPDDDQDDVSSDTSYHPDDDNDDQSAARPLRPQRSQLPGHKTMWPDVEGPSLRRHRLKNAGGRDDETQHCNDEKLIDRDVIKKMCPPKLPMTQKSPAKNKKYVCKICSKKFKFKSFLAQHNLLNHKNKPGMYKCEVCNVSFHYVKDLKKHQIKHHPDFHFDKFNCRICDREFKSNAILRKHNDNLHSSIRPFKCDTCGDTFKQKYTLTAHVIAAHTSERNFPCKSCTQSFKFSYSLKVHTLRKHNNNSKNFQCHLCCSFFKTKNDVRNHIFAVHKEKKYFCSACNKGFMSIVQFDIHNERHHSNVIRKYKCNMCSAALRTEFDLKSHVKYMHIKTKKFPCSQCKLSFKTIHEMHAHVKRIHSTQLLVQCDQCPGTFKGKIGLKYHKISIHSNKDPQFSCKTCNKTFKRKAGLKNHILRIHSVDPPQYKCELCPATFKINNDMRRHKDNKHSSLSLPCSECGRNYPSLRLLQRHKRIVHSGKEGDFVCDLCPASFKSEIYLQKHKKRMHTDNRYSCQHCGKVYKYKDILIIHMKQHAKYTRQ